MHTYKLTRSLTWHEQCWLYNLVGRGYDVVPCAESNDRVHYKLYIYKPISDKHLVWLELKLGDSFER